MNHIYTAQESACLMVNSFILLSKLNLNRLISDTNITHMPCAMI